MASVGLADRDQVVEVHDAVTVDVDRPAPIREGDRFDGLIPDFEGEGVFARWLELRQNIHVRLRINDSEPSSIPDFRIGPRLTVRNLHRSPRFNRHWPGRHIYGDVDVSRAILMSEKNGVRIGNKWLVRWLLGNGGPQRTSQQHDGQQADPSEP